ncbi:unnamed protein product, partial [Coregonus sp. 'balchen']
HNVGLFSTGLSILPSSVPHQFHFVNINKTWTEAQSICRQNYTDLATVDDMADMERLNSTVVAGLTGFTGFTGLTGLTEPAWIGLYNRNWRWSLEDTELDTERFWEIGQPDNIGKNELCVWMKDGLWYDDTCGGKHDFVCYGEFPCQSAFSSFCMSTSQTPKSLDSKTWSEAQNYCRKNHKDLASVKDIADKHTIQNIIQATFAKRLQNKVVPTEEVWIGLYREWKWSDQSGSPFRNWMAGEPNWVYAGEQHGELCVEVKFPSGQWNDHDCNVKQPFICYDDKLVLVPEKKTWSEALCHCRYLHMELVSVQNQSVQHWVRQRAKKASTPFVWLGLRYTCTLDFWFWVTGEESCYHNWADGEGYNTGKEQCGNTGAIQRDGGQWVGLPETDRFNFICSN